MYNSPLFFLLFSSFFSDTLCKCADLTNWLLLLLHQFNGLFSRTTWVSHYQKGKTSLYLNEAKDYGVLGCIGISWTTCKQSAPRCRQTTMPAPHHSFFLQAGCSSWCPADSVKVQNCSCWVVIRRVCWCDVTSSGVAVWWVDVLCSWWSHSSHCESAKHCRLQHLPCFLPLQVPPSISFRHFIQEYCCCYDYSHDTRQTVLASTPG